VATPGLNGVASEDGTRYSSVHNGRGHGTMSSVEEISLEQRNSVLTDAVARRCLDGYFVVFNDPASATAILNRPGKESSWSKWGLASLFMGRKERRLRIWVNTAGSVIEEESTG
jgi:hypothetical protein